jgi:NitT/TauT family transport system substrate-binding protein
MASGSVRSRLDRTVRAERGVYHNHPVGQPLIDQIRIAAEDLKLVKVMDPETDPKAFAERVTVNILA